MTRELAQIIDKETGDVNELRDKKLADATLQNFINTNDAIEMKTTTGEQVFITKDSFMQAIGQAFSASDPKTFTKLLGMNNGSPMGIDAYDLASVLGVPLGNIIINGRGSSKLSKRHNFDGGFLIASSISSGVTVTEVVPYYLPFEKAIFNDTVKIKRTTDGGQVDIVDDNNIVLWTYISVPY